MKLEWIGRLFRHGNGANLKRAECEPGSPLIELKNVVKSFEVEAGTFYALRGLDLTVRSGEFVAVVGKSGSGKSTMINMITGIDRPTSGEIEIGGVAVHTLTENQLAIWRGRNIGVVFQFFQLLPTLSILDNIVLPMDFCNCFEPGERAERAMELLAMVDLAEQAKKRPTALSGGQQQRAAIARALANDPPLLVADEPTGNLDSATADAVFSLFEGMVAQGRTIVMVTHDNDLAGRASRAVHVSDGRIVNDHG